jgi:hypothetical protein
MVEIKFLKRKNGIADKLISKIDGRIISKK